jgi:hypothetical protein
MKNRKFLIFLGAVAVIALLFWISTGDRTAGDPDSPTSINQMDQTQVPQQSQGMTPDAGTHPLPVVESATIAVQNGEGKDLGTYTLEPGETASVEGTDLKIKLGDFFNHWSFNEGPQNMSHDPVNPAAKIDVMRDGETVYYGWAFANVEFFRMQMHGGAEGHGGAADQLAFTLRSWEGLSFPSHGHTGE